MRVLLSWLRELVPFDDEPERIAERLSLAGLAVEEIIHTGAGISGVLVGEVLAMREHPNADNLMLVRASDGQGERDIVCGARNYEPGDRVPMALPGARLPNGMEIGRRVVRGETSDGMLCSARELELADDHTGILILDRDAPLGKDLVAALDLGDIIFDIDVTPNRPDCLSVAGIAREISALYGIPVRLPDHQPPEGDVDAQELATVSIEDPKGCPRYVARVIDGVSIGRSPWWLRRRLMGSGMRPISNIVDVTNYVMLERGQPLHAFDLDRLAGGAIVVRRPRKEERAFTTLDDQERTLTREDVMICDAERPVAIGGVMGGADAEVSARTTRILLESAAFDPVKITRTARRLGLRTEASMRFERGVNPDGARTAADLAARLFAELAGGTVARGAVDVYPRPRRVKPVRVRVARANSLIGIEADSGEMVAALRALGCEVEASRTALKVTPPNWRLDLSIEEDLVEEIARIYGYDRVPERLPGGARAGGLSVEQRRRRLVRRLMLGAGLSEAMTLSLLPATLADRLELEAEHPLRHAHRLANPLSEDEMLLRPSLVWGLLLAAQRNVARRVLPVRLFEVGTIFGRDGDAIVERQQLGWVMTGPARAEWHTPERELDFFDAKGILDALASGLGIDGLTVEQLRPTGWSSVLHPGRSAAAFSAGTQIGYVAELHPRIADRLELPRRVAVGIVDLEVVVAGAREGAAPEVSRLPAIHRDIAVVTPQEVPATEVAAVIEGAGGPLLESVRLFDVYRGDQIAGDAVSLAFALSFRHLERTLTDAEADEGSGSIRDAVMGRGWSIRE